MDKQIKNYADSGDIKALKYIFADALDVDPTFVRYEEEYNYCKSIPGFLEPHRELTPFVQNPADWDDAYWMNLKMDLIKNFSDQRMTHMREVAKVYLADKIERILRERAAARATAPVQPPTAPVRPAEPKPEPAPKAATPSKAEQERELEETKRKLEEENRRIEADRQAAIARLKEKKKQLKETSQSGQEQSGQQRTYEHQYVPAPKKGADEFPKKAIGIAVAAVAVIVLVLILVLK